MKKLISVVLCLALIIGTCSVLVNARTDDSVIESAADYPIIFVTGIGQSYSYYYSDVKEAAKYPEKLEAALADPNAPREIDGADARWNLFCNDFGFAFKEFGTYVSILGVAGGLLMSAFGINLVPRAGVDNIVKTLFRYNIIDENGKLPDNMITPRCYYPVSQYTAEQRENFYRAIPCKDIVDDIGEDMLYCFNYSAFSFTYDNAKGLDELVTKAKAQTGKDKVVLVPMSMGASVVSAYLQKYGDKGDVARVVSIVGAWDGSDVFADLIMQSFAKDAPDKLYNGIVAELIGEPAGYLVNIVLRIFPKRVLRSIIDEILGSLVDNLILKTPSLLALIPGDRYPEIREKVLVPRAEKYIIDQADEYYRCQTGLKERLQKLNTEKGVEFYYLAGYGLGFGGLGSEGIYNSDYAFFRFMRTADDINSDEIIQISSTATGATYAQRGSTLTAKGDAKYLSPDKTVDLSTCFFPDHVWLFHLQKHELENNNTALKLALKLACGQITGVEDPNSAFPRFNESRDLKKLTRDYLPALYRYVSAKTIEKWETEGTEATAHDLTDAQVATIKAFLAQGSGKTEADNFRDMLTTLGIYTDKDSKKASNEYYDDFCKWHGMRNLQNVLTPEQFEVYSNTIAMTDNVINDRDADDAKIAALYNMMVDLGIYKASAPKEDKGGFLKDLNDTVYKIFGAKGFVDLFNKNA